MLALLMAHKVLVLSALLSVSEIIGLLSGKLGVGGMLDAIIKGLKAVGAKDPEA